MNTFFCIISFNVIKFVTQNVIWIVAYFHCNLIDKIHLHD